MASRLATNHRVMLSSEDFHWLSGLEFSGASVPSALDSSTVVSISETGELTMFISSLSRAFLYDSTLYFGTIKSWLCPVIEYPIINPVRAYRFVSYILIIVLTFNYYIIR